MRLLILLLAVTTVGNAYGTEYLTPQQCIYDLSCNGCIYYENFWPYSNKPTGYTNNNFLTLDCGAGTTSFDLNIFMHGCLRETEQDDWECACDFTIEIDGSTTELFRIGPDGHTRRSLELSSQVCVCESPNIWNDNTKQCDTGNIANVMQDYSGDPCDFNSVATHILDRGFWNDGTEPSQNGCVITFECNDGDVETMEFINNQWVYSWRTLVTGVSITKTLDGTVSTLPNKICDATPGCPEGFIQDGPTCKCPGVNVPNAVQSVPNTAYGQSFTVQCNTGFTGGGQWTCGSNASFTGIGCLGCQNGIYDSSTLSCICDAGFHAVDNGCVACTNGIYDPSTLSCICDAGFHAVDNVCVACTAGKYSTGNGEACQTCAIGKTSDNGASECQNYCTGGTVYQPAEVTYQEGTDGYYCASFNGGYVPETLQSTDDDHLTELCKAKCTNEPTCKFMAIGARGSSYENRCNIYKGICTTWIAINNNWASDFTYHFITRTPEGCTSCPTGASSIDGLTCTNCAEIQQLYTSNNCHNTCSSNSTCTSAFEAYQQLSCGTC